MAAKPVNRILIVGGGTAGWMTAAALSRLLPRHAHQIRLVESAEIGTVGVGEATVPHIRFFNAKLGFDEADFMARTMATFKLGIEFRNWGRVGDSYIHPFGEFGKEIAGVQFHHHWLRMKRAGLELPLDAFSVPILAARMDRFAPPVSAADSPLATYSYAYQFDAGLYAAFLRDYAENHGVVRTEGKIVDVALNPENGHVASVALESGERIEADLFVDCSGFRGLLIEEALRSGYETWTHWLPCDRAVAVPCATNGPQTPYTRATALESGWVWRIPLQHRVGNGHVYCSSFMGDDEAEAALIDQLESPPLSSPRRLRFTTGRRRKQWNRNVVAIGLSAGFLEPLESTSIHLIQLAIGRLLDLFPHTDWDPTNEEEFNRSMHIEYERVRDFLILHYHATQRDDSPFWNYCRTMSVPDSLRYKMELFRERGVVAQYREGMFLDASWLAVYFGQNIVPRHYDPLSDKVPEPELASYLRRMAETYRGAAQSLPTHADYIEQLVAPRRAVHMGRTA